MVYLQSSKKRVTLNSFHLTSTLTGHFYIKKINIQQFKHTKIRLNEPGDPSNRLEFTSRTNKYKQYQQLSDLKL